MGNHIANALIDILQREGTLGSPSQLEFEDDFVFEEEEGNPRKISEGYVVVRKKDLD